MGQSLKPGTCRECAHRLAGGDPHPAVHQVHEVPVIKPYVVEYRCHRLKCPQCGVTTVAAVPTEAVLGYGPRAQAVSAMLTGSCRRGKRAVSRLFDDRFGLPLSPAMVCKLQHTTAAALAPVAGEALAYTREHPANVDETGWKQRHKRVWLWVAVTTLVVAFVIRKTRCRGAFDDLRDGSPQVHTTDRYPVYAHLPVHRRQVCWAHLRRDFQAMVDRANAGSGVGVDLLACCDELFEHGYRVRDGTLARSTFRRRYARAVRVRVRTHLERGVGCGCPKTATVFGALLAVEPSLWTFARVPGIEPIQRGRTRGASCGVLAQNQFGNRRRGGCRFVERILTVIASCRRQGRNVLTFLTDAVTAHRTGTQPPTLIPTEHQQPQIGPPALANC